MSDPSICRAPGCTSARLSSTYSPFCPAHRRNLTRHGHPTQVAINARELAPMLAAVKAWRKRNPSSDAWGILLQRWQQVVDVAVGILARRQSGETYILQEAQAAEMLRTVADAVDPTQVMDVVLALYLLQDQQPSRFKDDVAHRFAIVRRVRHLAPMSRGSHWSHKARKVTQVYREAPPRAVEIMAGWLIGAFGAAGVQMAGMERQRQQKADQDRVRLADAFGAMT